MLNQRMPKTPEALRTRLERKTTKILALEKRVRRLERRKEAEQVKQLASFRYLRRAKTNLQKAVAEIDELRDRLDPSFIMALRQFSGWLDATVRGLVGRRRKS